MENLKSPQNSNLGQLADTENRLCAQPHGFAKEVEWLITLARTVASEHDRLVKRLEMLERIRDAAIRFRKPWRSDESPENRQCDTLILDEALAACNDNDPGREVEPVDECPRCGGEI